MSKILPIMLILLDFRMVEALLEFLLLKKEGVLV